MKKKLIMLLIWVMPYAASAQSVKYSYDNAGNRIKREIVMKAKSFYKETSTTECFSEKLSDKDIRIYPNPTKGISFKSVHWAGKALFQDIFIPNGL